MKSPGSRFLVIGILFLTSLILQVNIVYACQLMEEIPRSSCCCDEPEPDSPRAGDDCGGTVGMAAEDCCHVELAVKANPNLSNKVSVHPNNPVKTFYPHFFLPSPVDVITVFGTGRRPADNTILPGNRGTDIYLLTQRFRE